MPWTPRSDHEKVKELLDQNWRHIDIAKEVKLSRERIRQLDLRYNGRTGRERQIERRLTRAHNAPENAFTVAARERGLDVQGVPLSHMQPSSSLVRVNGYLCSLHRCIRRPLSHGIYWLVRRTQRRADFYIWECPKGFIILPPDAQPRTDTMITIEPRKRPGAYVKRHDYISHLNRWEHLEEKHENLKAS
jgi:hypothetical protein